MMRILYCNKYNYPFSGTEVYLFELMQMMREQDHQVALFSMANPRGGPLPYDQHFVPHLDFKNKEDGPFKRLRLALSTIYSQDARRRLGEMIEEFRPEVAHIRNIYHHLTPSILWELKRRNIPVLYHLNDFKLLCPTYNLVSRGRICERCQGGQFWKVVHEGCYFGGRQKAVVLAAEAYLHRWIGTYKSCVDRLLVPSHFVRSKLIASGWDGRKIEVLPHFQELPKHFTASPPPTAPMLYFGRLSAEKGVEDLLRAAQRIPTVSVKIAGDGPLRTELMELAASLRLENVEFLGHLQAENLKHKIADACCTVFPSHAYETLGKAILESYAQCRPVIASDLGSRREFVHHGKTGLLYPAGDVEQLARDMYCLHKRPQLAAAMGQAGWEYVRIHHSPETHHQLLTGLYEKLISEKRLAVQGRSTHALPTVATKPHLRIAFIGGRGVIGRYSGIEGYYEEVGQRLAAEGHEVTVYCRNYFTPNVGQHNGMRVVRLPAPRSKHFETVLHTLHSTLHVMFNPCDIVHYHALGPALFSWIPRLAGRKTAVTVQGLDWQRRKWSKLASGVLRLGEKAAIWCPDQTFVVSRTLHQYFHDRYAKNALYIANGAILRERRPARRIREWGLNEDNYILFLGRFSPEKNCHLLIEAYEKLDTCVKLVLAGSANPSDEYFRRLARHASDRIHLLKYVSGDTFDELLTNAMFFVLPSDMEGLSLALLEAMGAGVCVLASNIPENRELVEGAGFLFVPGDVVDLEEKLRFLIENPHVRQAAAHAAKQRIQQEYLWQDITSEIEHAYLKMMGWTAAESPSPTENRTPHRSLPWRAQRPGSVVIPAVSHDKRAA